MANNLDESIVNFIEHVGMMAQADGLPRIAGRLMGYFVVHGGPFSLSELAENLQISRASVSTNGRLLANLGILQKTSMPGERQDYYRLAVSPYKQMLQGYVDRMSHNVAVIGEMQGSLQGQKSVDAGMLDRINNMKDFYSKAIGNTQSIIADLS